MSPTPTIVPATDAHWPAVRSLLEAAGLPLDGVHEHLGDFVVALEGDEAVGVAGLELRGGDALLRSVAVRPDRRDRGLGAALADAALRRASSLGARRAWLLTTGAAGYFERLGFGRASRDEVPDAMRASSQFTGACPASATLMVRELRAA